MAERHLTAVENRLNLLESVLGRIFPSGEMQDISRDLLTGPWPGNSISTNTGDEFLSSDTLMFDDFLNTDQSVSPELRNPSIMDADSASQSVTQADIPVASAEEESKFVDAYFASYHTLYPILHEDTYRSAQSAQLTSPGWPVLSNMVLAYGAWLSSDAGLDKAYYARAEAEFEKLPMAIQGNLTLVQGLVLLSEYAQKHGIPEKSGRYIGYAVHMAVNLHLQLEPRGSGDTELDKEIRRRVWWSVYWAESCSAKIYGRPLLLPEDALITVNPVSNIQERVMLSLLPLLPSAYQLPLC